MRIVVDKHYEKYRSYIRRIPSGEWPVKKTFCNNRNIVYMIEPAEGEQWVVKKFKRPTLANCVIYTWFRTDKAKRSFMYAYRLLGDGIQTARPIAYIEISRHGFFHTGYYICEYLPFQRLDKMDMTDEHLKECFVDYIVELYEKGIVNYDLNPSNILVDKDDNGDFHFSLIDINRIRFKVTSWRKHIHAFIRCINYGSEFEDKSKTLFQINIMSEYCIQCGMNLLHVVRDIHLYRIYKIVINTLHRLLKKIIEVCINKYVSMKQRFRFLPEKEDKTI